MRYRSLTRSAGALLERLQALAAPELRGWTLVGGAAVALHLGHRAAGRIELTRDGPAEPGLAQQRLDEAERALAPLGQRRRADAWHVPDGQRREGLTAEPARFPAGTSEQPAGGPAGANRTTGVYGLDGPSACAPPLADGAARSYTINDSRLRLSVRPQHWCHDCAWLDFFWLPPPAELALDLIGRVCVAPARADLADLAALLAQLPLAGLLAELPDKYGRAVDVPRVRERLAALGFGPLDGRG